MNGALFLSVADLMRLTGLTNQTYAYAKHKQIRDGIFPGKKQLTIREYCSEHGYEYGEIFRWLRGNDPP